jgi:hypothetical protein
MISISNIICLLVSSALEELQEFKKGLIDPFDKENGDPEIKTKNDVYSEIKIEKEEAKKENEKDSVPEKKKYVPHPNRLVPIVPKVAKKEVEKAVPWKLANFQSLPNRAAKASFLWIIHGGNAIFATQDLDSIGTSKNCAGSDSHTFWLAKEKARESEQSP